MADIHFRLRRQKDRNDKHFSSDLQAKDWTRAERSARISHLAAPGLCGGMGASGRRARCRRRCSTSIRSILLSSINLCQCNKEIQTKAWAKYNSNRNAGAQEITALRCRAPALSDHKIAAKMRSRQKRTTYDEKGGESGERKAEKRKLFAITNDQTHADAPTEDKEIDMR